MRRSPLKKATIRALASNEPDPDGPPKEYRLGPHVRLRWKVAPYTYVERYKRNEDGTIVRTAATVAKRIDVAKAIRLCSEDRTMVEVARLLGCNHAALSRALSRAGYRPPSTVERVSNVDVHQMAELYAAGLSIDAVANRTGVTVARARRTLREAGVALRPGGNRSRGRSYETEFRAMKPVIQRRSGGRCEAAASPACRGRAGHVHHRLRRGQGGPNTEENLLHVCETCHQYIHLHPQVSYARGWLVRSSYSMPDTPRLEARTPDPGDRAGADEMRGDRMGGESDG